MDINTIALLGLILAIIVSIFLILSLRSFNKLLQETTSSIAILTQDISNNLNTLTKDFSELKDNLTVTLSNVNTATKQLTDTTQNIDNEVQKAHEIINSVGNLVHIVTHKVYPSLSYTASLISASSKAVSTFVDFFKRK